MVIMGMGSTSVVLGPCCLDFVWNFVGWFLGLFCRLFIDIFGFSLLVTK